MKSESVADINPTNRGVERGSRRNELRKATIKDVLRQSGGFTTFELGRMIVSEPGDNPLGSKAFEELFASLRQIANDESIDPAFVWAGTSSTPLVEAMRPLMTKNTDLLRWILRHGSFADLRSPNGVPIVVQLKGGFRAPGSAEPAALTASRSTTLSTTIQYDIYYHPSMAQSDDANEACCEQVDSPGVWFDEIVRGLHTTHQEVLLDYAAAQDGDNYKKLKRKGILLRPLDSYFLAG